MSLPNAITREDFYLNKIANPSDDHELPDAITRQQHYLKAIAENAGGGGGGGGDWVEVGHATGDTGISIGSIFSDASEFAIVINANNDPNNSLIITIPKIAITGGTSRVSAGGEPNIALITLSNITIASTYVKWGSDVTSTSVTTVYYK